MADQLLLSISITAIGLLCAWLVYKYVTFKRTVCNTLRVAKQLLLRVMDDIDKLITDLVKEEEPVAIASQQQTVTTATLNTSLESSIESKRERLAASVAGGQFNLKYKGGLLTEERLSKLSDQEVLSLYANYEARLGSAIMRSLGRTATRLYVHTLRQAFPKVLPEEEVKPLISDLETDPFLQQMLGDTCCRLYHTFGKLLAPLSVGLITANHCKIGAKADTPQEEAMLSSNGPPCGAFLSIA